MSDSYGMKEVDGTVYEVDCQMITSGGIEVDTGANASAEEADEGIEDGAVQVNNVVEAFRLTAIEFDLKSYKSHLKTYMKKVKEALVAKGEDEETVKDFQSGASKVAGKIFKDFDNYDCYAANMNLEGMVVLMNYREDGVTPFVTIWKHGLVEQKVWLGVLIRKWVLIKLHRG